MSARSPADLGAGGVLVDVQGLQSQRGAKRGFGRYTFELATALVRRECPLVDTYLLNPDRVVPARIDALRRTAPVEFSDRVDLSQASVYHAVSPFEEVSLDRIWPAGARGARMRLAVTFYDPIPLVYPDSYLADPAHKSWYTARLELVRQADSVLAISESAGRDATTILGIPPHRIAVVGTGVSDTFIRPSSRERALAAARGSLPELEDRFVLYVGGADPRKNIHRLLDAYGALREETRAAHQLVIVSDLDSIERAWLEPLVRRLGVEDRVRFAGFVADSLLASLYQACELFVCPSLYEGFGLPVAEAISCGAPVVGSDTSSLSDLIRDRAARFDPLDVRAIKDVLERALGTESLRARLRDVRPDPGWRWDVVAERTETAYRRLMGPPD